MSKNLYRSSEQRDPNHSFKTSLRLGIILILVGIGLYFYLQYQEKQPTMELPLLIYFIYSIGGKLLTSGLFIALGLFFIIAGRYESNQAIKKQKQQANQKINH